jgi:membrane protein involved in colicin uptake
VKRIISLAAGVAIGYVLGSRAGRDNYEQIAAAARRFSGHPAEAESEAEAETGAQAAAQAEAEAGAEAEAEAEAKAEAEAEVKAEAEAEAKAEAEAEAKQQPGPAGSRTTGASRAPRKRSAAAADREELGVAAKERIEDLPGETALGNADPAAGGHGDPLTYEGEQNH